LPMAGVGGNMAHPAPLLDQMAFVLLEVHVCYLPSALPFYEVLRINTCEISKISRPKLGPRRRAVAATSFSRDAYIGKRHGLRRCDRVFWHGPCPPTT
jgi:hypothetical protein